MPSRIATLKANTTTPQWASHLLVGAVFLVISAVILVRDGDPNLLIASVTGLMIPWRLRRYLVGDPKTTTGILRKVGYGIVASATVASIFKDSLLAAGAEDWAWLPMGLMMLYVGAFFTVYSDPSVEVLEP